MYYGAQFGDYHSYRDWGLYLNQPPEISPPEPQTYYVDVPGRDGTLDLTETLTGGVAYNDRTIAFHFVTNRPKREWARLHHEILNAIHGRSMQIVLDEDPEYYYEGRVTVSEWDPRMEDKMEFPEIVATVRPFKWERADMRYEYKSSEDVVEATQVEVIGGKNVAEFSWNTDWRYGTEEIPTFDFSAYDAIYIEGVMSKSFNKLSMQYVSCTDGVKAVYNLEYHFGANNSFAIYTSIDTLRSEGIDPSTLYRILLTGASSATVYVYTQPAVAITMLAGVRTRNICVFSQVYHRSTGEEYDYQLFDYLLLNGKKYDLDIGATYIEDIAMNEGENILLFPARALEDGTFTKTYYFELEVTCQRGWL